MAPGVERQRMQDKLEFHVVALVAVPLNKGALFGFFGGPVFDNKAFGGTGARDEVHVMDAASRHVGNPLKRELHTVAVDGVVIPHSHGIAGGRVRFKSPGPVVVRRRAGHLAQRSSARDWRHEQWRWPPEVPVFAKKTHPRIVFEKTC